MRTSAKILGMTLFMVGILASLIWYATIREDHRGTLTVSFLHVTEGDAILIESPSGRSILIDGGPDNSVVRELGSAVPFYDRSIDMLIARSPSPQIVSGLSDVLARYQIDAIVRSAACSSAPQTQSFAAAIAKAQQNGSRLIIAKRGDVFDLGSRALLEVMFPDRDAQNMSAGDACLTLKLLYGTTSFLFACGSESVENYLAQLDGGKLHANVLLATGDESTLFAGLVSPEVAVMPCGSDESAAFTNLNIKTLDMCEGATFISDGNSVIRR